MRLHGRSQDVCEEQLLPCAVLFRLVEAALEAVLRGEPHASSGVCIAIV